MSKPRKIVVVGAGSLRTLVLVHDACELARKHGAVELVLMDTARERAATVERLARRMPGFEPGAVALSATDDFDRAADGADLVQVVLRVDGAAEGRDVGICLEHGLHGDDTYGPSAITLGLRTVPVLLRLAQVMERRCPDAWLCIFSNPVTMNTDVLNRHTRIKTLGICGGVENFWSDFHHLHFDPEPFIEGLRWRGAGLNHFSWVTRDSTFRGEPVGDYLRRLIPTLDEGRLNPLMLWYMEKRIFAFTGQMPMNNGHFYHYFLWDEYVAERRQRLRAPPRPPAPDPWPARMALARQASIANYWQELQGSTPRVLFDRIDPALKAAFSMWYDLGWEVGLNLPNRGHVVDLPEGHVVETFCRVGAHGPEPLGLDAVPPMIKGLVRAVSVQQRMVADLLVNPSKPGMAEAIFADPCHRLLGPVLAVTDKLWAEFERWRAAQAG